jgi:Bacterial regulatory protein, Fis family
VQSEESHNSVYMSALAHLHDSLPDLPAWFRRLTPGQVQCIARLMVRWHTPPRRAGGTDTRVDEFSGIPTLHTVERDAIFRAIQLSDGDIIKAAAALHIGKSTIYRKIREWGGEAKAISQASALATCRMNYTTTQRGTEAVHK